MFSDVSGVVRSLGLIMCRQVRLEKVVNGEDFGTWYQ